MHADERRRLGDLLTQLERIRSFDAIVVATTSSSAGIDAAIRAARHSTVVSASRRLTRSHVPPFSRPASRRTRRACSGGRRASTGTSSGRTPPLHACRPPSRHGLLGLARNRARRPETVSGDLGLRERDAGGHEASERPAAERLLVEEECKRVGRQAHRRHPLGGSASPSRRNVEPSHCAVARMSLRASRGLSDRATPHLVSVFVPGLPVFGFVFGFALQLSFCVLFGRVRACDCTTVPVLGLT
ncbi:MAG: hypothetical protein JWP97_4361 [Labilithrix sp.]|nr:hypothetical protein [Labilithrix sp.]